MVLTSDPSHYTQPRLKHWSIFMKSSQCLLARMLIVSTHRPSLYGPQSLRDDSLRLESDKKVLSESTVVQSIKCATFVTLQSLSFVFTARCQNKRKHSKFLLLWGNCLISHLVNKLEDAFRYYLSAKTLTIGLQQWQFSSQSNLRTAFLPPWHSNLGGCNSITPPTFCGPVGPADKMLPIHCDLWASNYSQECEESPVPPLLPSSMMGRFLLLLDIIL